MAWNVPSMLNRTMLLPSMKTSLRSPGRRSSLGDSNRLRYSVHLCLLRYATGRPSACAASGCCRVSSSSSSRSGPPRLIVWMPSTLTSCGTAVICYRVAPSSRALRIWRRVPDAYRCAQDASTEMQINSITARSSTPAFIGCIPVATNRSVQAESRSAAASQYDALAIHVESGGDKPVVRKEIVAATLGAMEERPLSGRSRRLNVCAKRLADVRRCGRLRKFVVGRGSSRPPAPPSFR